MPVGEASMARLISRYTDWVCRHAGSYAHG